ncbi:alpha/beta fold hydrolase [Streptomyces showdoensis]|uniref:Transporter n=1 Tax=Streptomyces showdoensis TaxID=68268 RepID=A0A2P2GNU3_STREW|nr:alpha/beta fold hydrolase [Streptomyces showdoensis]KKZ72539.1 transporter [Streptomyces showdoensis]
MTSPTPRRPARPSRRLPAVLAGATAGALVVGLAALPARAESGAGAPLGTVARTAGGGHFEPGPCPRTADPIPDLARAHCGTLTVPENRSRRHGRRITLAVAIIPAVGRRPASDPIVWLAGGPGDDAVSEIPMAVAGGLNRDRDVIFMSQRGTYSADPQLTCPNVDEFAADSLGLAFGAPSTGRLHVRETRKCRDRVVNRGADPSAYDGPESAADYDALRKALGIMQWNVFGISYGTNLALHYMRLHPEGIRSVGIDGVLPPALSGGAVTWKAAREGYDGLFRACEEQPACNNRYPHLKGTFERLVSEVEARPVTTSVTVPGRSRPVKVVLDGGVLVNWLASATHVAAGVPRSIDELAHGNPQRIAAQWAGGKLSPQAIGRTSHGLAYGVFCREWTPYESEADIVRAGRRLFPSFPRSVLVNAPFLSWLHPDCRAWDVPPADPSVRQRTYSDIPTLVLSGGFDAQTAPSNGAYAARTLSRSTAVTVPYVAHVVFADSTCAQTITVAFFDRPGAPDTRCLAGLRPPTFEIAP